MPQIAVSAPLVDGHGPTTASTSAKSSSSPLRHRAFQGRQFKRPSRPKSLSVPREHGIARNLTTRTLTHPGSDDKVPKPQSEPSKLSAVYHPDVKRALDFQLAHLVTYGSRVLCAKACPDGQRVAVGLAHDGKTYINELKTGTKIWFVPRRLV